MDTKKIKITDYDYPLPDGRIAKYPLAERDASKLLVYRHGEVSEHVFRELPDLLPEGALMVFNNTKVIQARLHFRKATGAVIEVFLLEPVLPHDYERMFQTKGECAWYCMIGNLKKWKGETLVRDIPSDGGTVHLSAERGEAHGTSWTVRFTWDADISFAELLDRAGELPIPPYLNRKTEESDKRTYQTVYSKIKGSVAAPTAGLHFTPRVLADIDNKGILREEVTLHVGAGTFKPVKSEEIEGHEMHTETFAVARSTVQALLDHDCRAVAVGTTSVRTLESLYFIGCRILRRPEIGEDELCVNQWEPYESDFPWRAEEAVTALAGWMDRHEMTVLHSATRIIIAPGYRYRIVRMLVTNFHQPKSTLLLLVSAFVSGDWRKIYDYALGHGFRFLSYGDSSLLIP